MTVKKVRVTRRRRCAYDATTIQKEWFGHKVHDGMKSSSLGNQTDNNSTPLLYFPQCMHDEKKEGTDTPAPKNANCYKIILAITTS